MATYSTDLTTITTAESGTWTELASPYNTGGSPGLSGENFIQGTDCYAQNSGKANGLEISIAFNNGSDLSGSFAADDVVFAWLFYAVGTNLETYANSGWRFAIGTSTSAWSWYRVGGSDYGRNPYGGWTNFAIDPTATATGTIGGGNGGAYQYFGNVPYTINEITKGDPTAVDAIRYGRGIISVIGTGGSFAELASYNDYNAGGTPPGTSSTSIDTGRHRLGLFQEQGGTYLWKGILSLGTVASSVTFSDANETIIIDDCPHTYATFNKVEINNASSSVTLTNITITSTATTANGVGYFEMVANATTVDLIGCSFNNMGLFTFLSNADVQGCSFNSCGQIDSGGGSFNNSNVLDSTVAADTGALVWNSATDPDGSLDNMTFSKGTAAHHAIDFGTSVTGDILLRGIEFTGFGSTDNANDSTVRFLATSGSLTLSLAGCTVDGVAASASNFSFDNAAGIGVTLSIDPVTIQITVRDNTGTLLENARVIILAEDATGALPFRETVTSILRSGTTATVTHTAHGMVTGDKVSLSGITDKTIDNSGTHLITVTGVNTYTYTTTNEGSTNYTGTILSTGVFLEGLTNVSGVISRSRVVGANTPIKGYVRKSSASPRFKSFDLAGNIVSATTGLTGNIRMVIDE